MEFRRLILSDLEPFFSCRLRALANAPTAFVTILEEEKTRGPDRFAKTLADQGEDQVIFGAVIDGTIVGTAGIYRGDRLKTRHKASITGMYVDDDQQRRGVGGRLLDCAIAQAQEKMKISAIYLSLEANNVAARRLYE